MGPHKENMGTRKDLVFYRLQTAKADLKSARILLAAEEYKGANNRAYYAIFHAIVCPSLPRSAELCGFYLTPAVADE